jgi:hypothetical protein
MMATRYPHLEIQKNCRTSRCQDQSLMLARKVQAGLDEAQQHFFAAASVGSERNSAIRSQEIQYKCSHEICTEVGPELRLRGQQLKARQAATAAMIARAQ